MADILAVAEQFLNGLAANKSDFADSFRIHLGDGEKKLRGWRAEKNGDGLVHGYFNVDITKGRDVFMPAFDRMIYAMEDIALGHELAVSEYDRPSSRREKESGLKASWVITDPEAFWRHEIQTAIKTVGPDVVAEELDLWLGRNE